MTAALSSLEQKYQQAQENLLTSNTKCKNFQDKLQVMEKQHKQQLQALQLIENAFEDEKNRCHSLQETIDVLNAEIKNKAKALMNALARAKDAEERLSQMQNVQATSFLSKQSLPRTQVQVNNDIELHDLKQELDKLRRLNSDLERQLADKEYTFKNLNEEHRSLQQEIGKRKVAISGLEMQINQLKTQLEDMKGQCQQQRYQTTPVENVHEIKIRNQQISSLEAQKRELQQQVISLEQQV